MTAGVQTRLKQIQQLTSFGSLNALLKRFIRTGHKQRTVKKVSGPTKCLHRLPIIPLVLSDDSAWTRWRTGTLSR